MNTERLYHTTKRLLILAVADLDIKFYFPPAANPPWESPIRYMAWDCYGPRIAIDQTELARYGGKAYYIEGNPLSIHLAQHQLLTGIAVVLKCHFGIGRRVFARMLEIIYDYAAQAFDSQTNATKIPDWTLPTLA